MDVHTPHAPVAPRPPRARVVVGLALIGAVLAAIGGTFAYLRGWFTPGRLTPDRFTDTFEQVDGPHPGFRRNHAKGVGVTGHFDSNGQGERLSKALVFRPGRVPVIGRFSLGGGQPYGADSPAAVRGLGLQFTQTNGELWRTAMINLPIFPFRTPEAFHENLEASKPDPQTGKPDPARGQAFLARHPETARVLGALKALPVPSGFGNSAYHGLNAFLFTAAAGASTPVRWELTPEQPFVAADAAPGQRDKSYLFDDIITQIPRQPLRWRLILVVGQPGDPTDDATIPWPADRERVDAGTLVLDGVESDDTALSTDITFDPLVLPAGIAPSNDPLLSARSAVYARSYTRRAGEPKQPAAVTPADARGGK
ncbi:Catalase-related peroxidase precursor [Gemmata obscuriglobus]|uniref:Catalase-related peroxidase n=1 Tax=Gemmata obscuriglobus TaxID=114 RepID=A0A2Z3H4D0_9BACT|nr:catalase family peroxidase [Gemmata obscuriglobus]AWM41639.1 catalase [Gemmata obscuriglobus]QEG32431.1 Catalase-related peroxidase precursor [Gemmata obscuriglobus]VTS11787.1 catalase : Catalase-related peroxidase OS=Methylobacterium extorquens (strain CM4 / NCIMB 13688) GN=Mchl_0174 PE=3 SV=1: Catalase [Gemmata obscuriglobus UQM 2246]